MVIPKGEQLCLVVTPKNIIGDDDTHEADFQILDSSDVQLSSSNSPDSISTKVETHVSVDLMKTNIHASRFRFRWWSIKIKIRRQSSLLGLKESIRI